MTTQAVAGTNAPTANRDAGTQNRGSDSATRRNKAPKTPLRAPAPAPSDRTPARELRGGRRSTPMLLPRNRGRRGGRRGRPTPRLPRRLTGSLHQPEHPVRATLRGAPGLDRPGHSRTRPSLRTSPSSTTKAEHPGEGLDGDGRATTMINDPTSCLPIEFRYGGTGTGVWRVCLSPPALCSDSGTARITSVENPACNMCGLRTKVVCGWVVRKLVYVPPAREDDAFPSRWLAILREWIVTWWVRPYAFGMWFDGLWGLRGRATASDDVCLPIFADGDMALHPGCPDCGGKLDYDLHCSLPDFQMRDESRGLCGIKLVKLAEDIDASELHRCPRHPHGGQVESKSLHGLVEGSICSCRKTERRPPNIKTVRNGEGWRVSCQSCGEHWFCANRAVVRPHEPPTSAVSAASGYVAVLTNGSLIGAASGDKAACEEDAVARAYRLGAPIAVAGCSFEQVNEATVKRARAELSNRGAPRLLERLRFRRKSSSDGESEVLVRTGSNCICRLFPWSRRPEEDRRNPDPHCDQCGGSGSVTEDRPAGDVPDTVGLVSIAWDATSLLDRSGLPEVPAACPDCRPHPASEAALQGDDWHQTSTFDVPSGLVVDAHSNPLRCDWCGALWNMVGGDFD